MEIPHGRAPVVLTPALLQLGNFSIDVVDFAGTEGVSHALALMAQNGSICFTVPIPDPVWDEIAQKIERRHSPIVIPTNGGGPA